MDLPDSTDRSRRVPLSVPRADQWLLHSLLLDRIDREVTAAEPTTIDPPPLAVFQAFERLDAGETCFTIAQLEAIQTVLAEYHHTTTRGSESARLERLRHRITEILNQHQATRPAEG